MWEYDRKEGWTPKNWCFWTVMLKKTLESPLDCKEIQPVHPKGNQSWIFIRRTDVEAETPVLWPSDMKNSFKKTLMLGKIESRRRRGQQRMRWLDDITNSQSLLKLMFIELVMPSNHLILCHPLILLASIFPSIRVFSNESVLCITMAKVLEFQLQHQSF